MSIKMDKARWQQIQVILDDTLKQPEKERLAYIKRVCDEDHNLRHDIEELLAAEQDAPTFLEEPAALLVKTLFGHPEADVSLGQQDLEGKKIGAYLLREQLGQGGMGVVYRGERFQGEFEQEAAIKLVSVSEKGQRNNADRFERFQHEQQTLASLNHPNIARLYDGGLTDENQPYIVMEYVKGKDITRYCNEQKLDLKSRLQLIIQVAEVLAFAHVNLIVHRDIKPSNILINESGQVKLLDFGIAKLLSEDIPSELTKTGESILTPGFAAPEQIQKRNITIATDVYQLGLVMYELITGYKAFSDKAESLYELARVMCEKSPTVPSQMEVQNARVDSSTPQAWQNKLRGDLDAICMKALRLESEQRYRSMAEFADDIKAHLAGTLVQARQKNVRYLVSSYCQRNWKLLLAGSAFFVIVIAYAATVTLQSQQIQMALDKSMIETEKAQQVSNFMTDIFKSSDPNVSGLEKISAQQLLEKGQADIQQKLQNAPEIRAYMLEVLGDIYFSQGEYQQSAKLFEQALNQEQKTPTQNLTRLANTMTKLAISLGSMDQYQRSEQLLQDSLALYSQIGIAERESSGQQWQGSTLIEYAETLNAYATVLRTKGQHVHAEQGFNQALSALQTLDYADNEMAVSYNGLAGVQHVQGQFDLAIDNMQKGLDVLEEVHGERHTYFTVALNNMVMMLTDLERFEQAQSLSKRSLKIQQSMLGDNHPNLTSTLRSLGILSHRQGNFTEAKTYLENALRIRRQSLNDDNVSIAVILLFLGAVEQDMGNVEQASEHYQKMLALFIKHSVSDRTLGRGLCQPASLALANGQWQEAKQLYSQALDLLPESGVRRAIAQLGFARASIHIDSDLTIAEQKARSALTTRRDKFPAEHSLVAEAEGILGLVLAHGDKASDAIPLLSSSEKVLKSHPLYALRKSHENLLSTVQQNLAQLSQN